MEDEWIIRVLGQEYGPVDTATLREWKAEGRLIPTNEIRKVGEEQWVEAGTVPDIFGPTQPVPAGPKPALQPRTWPQILTETFRIYRSGFRRFILFGLLSAVPMFLLQRSLPTIKIPDLSTGSEAIPWPTVRPIAVIMLLVFFALWPIATAGFQFVADDILRGRTNSFANQFKAAVARWRVVFSGALLVYGSYFFWFVVPLMVLLGLARTGQISILGTILYLLTATFMVYMVARLIINFLFWQQTTALGPDRALSALRESKELARSVPDGPMLDRPLFRGVIIASAWLLLVLIFTMGIQLPFYLARFIGVANPEEAMALARTLAEAESPDALLMMADFASAALHLIMQPLLTAAFVVLYHDARARSGRVDPAEDEVSSD